MGFLDRLRAVFGREAADVREAWDDLSDSLERDLDRRERELHATPEEKIEILQGQIAANDDAFEAVRSRIEGQQAGAEAREDLAKAGGADGSAPGESGGAPGGADGSASGGADGSASGGADGSASGGAGG
ncbi:MAG: hypothetical protein OEY23_11850 [Acidimicrobiia bacterium]|nr:hypothetical protein [Acidimicrobiia bacterium]